MSQPWVNPTRSSGAKAPSGAGNLKPNVPYPATVESVSHRVAASGNSVTELKLSVGPSKLPMRESMTWVEAAETVNFRRASALGALDEYRAMAAANSEPEWKVARDAFGASLIGASVYVVLDLDTKGTARKQDGTPFLRIVALLDAARAAAYTARQAADAKKGAGDDVPF